jgi:hypothetical protein
MADNNKNIVKSKLEKDRDYQDNLKTKSRENEVLHKQDLEEKAAKNQ